MTDINDFLAQQQNKTLLRFLTCGSVDDGKSTLIGRLLYDCRQIYEDQLAEIRHSDHSDTADDSATDLSQLTDGLQAEREQGITIDVAYRYFSTDKREFIIADTPGHEQYTRNMATGASRCDLAVVMVDAGRGIQTQTRRHTYICHLLGIRHLIVAVNKMDVVNYQHQVFQQIKDDFREMVTDLNIADIRFVPMSAKHGDNVVSPSQTMDWYPGATLLKLLETVKISKDKHIGRLRFPVQYVNRLPDGVRGYCGTIAGGELSAGDAVKILPAGNTATVQSIWFNGEKLPRATPEQAVMLTLDKAVDISRGDMLTHVAESVTVGQRFVANLLWFDTAGAKVNQRYLIKWATKTTQGQIQAINTVTDIHTLSASHENTTTLQINEVGNVIIEVDEAIVIDNYAELPDTGAFIVIDTISYATIGAGMVLAAAEANTSQRQYTAAEIALNHYIRTHYPEWGCEAIK